MFWIPSAKKKKKKKKNSHKKKTPQKTHKIPNFWKCLPVGDLHPTSAFLST